LEGLPGAGVGQNSTQLVSPRGLQHSRRSVAGLKNEFSIRLKFSADASVMIGVLDGKSLLAGAPTSAGKTFVGEMAAAKAIAEGRKRSFYCPTMRW
jgi:replicative superfamily II helicase